MGERTCQRSGQSKQSPISSSRILALRLCLGVVRVLDSRCMHRNALHIFKFAQFCQEICKTFYAIAGFRGILQRVTLAQRSQFARKTPLPLITKHTHTQAVCGRHCGGISGGVFICRGAATDSTQVQHP